MKKYTGFIIAIAVLSFLLLISIGGNIYGYIKYQIRDKEYNDLYLEYSKVYRKSIRSDDNTSSSKYKRSSTKDSTSTSNDIKIYGSNYAVKVVGVDKQLYMLESDGSTSAASDYTCVKEIKNAKFDEHGKYSCTTKGLTANKLYIDTDKVNKVKVLHRVISGDISTDVFIIFNNGSTKQTGTDAFLKDAFKKYKVKDVKEYCSKRDSAGNCSVAGYELTLQDGKKTSTSSLS